MRNIAWSEPEPNRRLLEVVLVGVGALAALGGGVATAALHPAAGVAALVGSPWKSRGSGAEK